MDLNGSSFAKNRMIPPDLAADMLLYYSFGTLLDHNKEPPQLAHQICVFVSVVNLKPAIWMRKQLLSHLCSYFVNDFFL